MLTNAKFLMLISELSDAHAVAGFEGETREITIQHLKTITELSVDKIGNLICSQGKGTKVLLAAHLDEIGFMVQNITTDGFIQFIPLGGWWAHTLLSQRVIIKNRLGEKISGVIGSKPPHFLPESQRSQVLPIDSMFIDIGAESKNEVIEEYGIRLGDPIIPDTNFEEFNSPHRYIGKALDNRLGLAAMIECMEIMNELPHPNQIIGAATVQEELGTRGAKTLGNQIQPDCALILEAPPADDTPGFSLSDAQGKLGGGVQIRLYDPTAVMNPGLAHFLADLAEEHKIPYQLTVRKSGGTDAGALHLAGGGIPCVVLGVPTRYIHAHNGVFDIRDYRALIDLLKVALPLLDSETIARFSPSL